MAVDANSAPGPQSHFEYVHDTHHVFESSTRHVLPGFAKTVDSVLIEVLRDIAESDLGNDPIATVGMLLITISTSPGYCRLSTAFMFFSLNFE